MKIVIDIPKEMIKSLEQGNFGAKYNIYDLVECLMNGTPLPKGQKLFTPNEVWSIMVKNGQHDSQFKLGEIIKYSPTEVKKILEADKEGE